MHPSNLNSSPYERRISPGFPVTCAFFCPHSCPRYHMQLLFVYVAVLFADVLFVDSVGGGGAG